MEFEWIVLFGLAIVGNALFGRFEVETAWWKRILKWTILAVISIITYQYFGHWALLIIIGPALFGLIFHFIWCSKNGIHPLKASPRKKYYQLRGWDWKE